MTSTKQRGQVNNIRRMDSQVQVPASGLKNSSYVKVEGLNRWSPYGPIVAKFLSMGWGRRMQRGLDADIDDSISAPRMFTR